MNELIIYFLIALIFSFIGLFIGKLLTKLHTEKDKSALEFEVSKHKEAFKNTEITIDDLQSELRYIQK